ncbi:MAG: lysophospholipid acyltransferase family protein [Acidimicrobiales bacterium]
MHHTVALPMLTVMGVEPQRALLALARPALIPFARFDIDGVENIPEAGPAIVAGNHRSYFDPVALGMALARRGRPVRFLGKKEVFDAPMVGPLLRAMGGIRVVRGTGSEEPLAEAATALEMGQIVALMPQGTIPRGRAFFEPVLKGRWGAARLAGLSGAPVIPVGLWGTEAVWPRCERLPNLLALAHPPTVTVRVGKPVTGLKGESPAADTKRIMAAIAKLLPPEARKKQIPTAEQLERTFPPGYSGDPETEDDRRPGRD